MTTNPPADRTFLLQDLITGQFLPERYDWDGARAAQADRPLTRIRRLDEALQERGTIGSFHIGGSQ